LENRTRTRIRRQVIGKRLYDGALDAYYEIDSYVQETKDAWKKEPREDGSLPPSFFESTIWDYRRTGTASFQSGHFTLVDMPYINTQGSASNSFWTSREGSDSELIARLLANTNPFRYEVSVPILLSELVEAATLFKIATKTFASLFGSAWLNWNFGWLTLIQDLRALSSITKAIESRILEFNSLIQRGGLRRKVWLNSWQDTAIDVSKPFSTTYATSIYGNVINEYRTKVWGSVRWRPKRGVTLPVDRLSQFNLALKQVLDLDSLDAATIWEAIPFSWLIDYFTNVGDTLRAIESTDLVEPYDICIMRHRQITTTRVPIWFPQGVTATRGVTKWERKLRYTYSVPAGHVALLSFGFITKHEASMIAALVASRKR
jgi:hypothetical protein